MRQLIIARKDLQMSPGKLAAQCCHASLAFLTDPIGMGQGVEPIENTRIKVHWAVFAAFSKYYALPIFKVDVLPV